MLARVTRGPGWWWPAGTATRRRCSGQSSAAWGWTGAVTFLGPRDDVPDLLCAADAVVIPSRWEGLSNVLIEAMALEAPVVASDLPTLEDAASDGETAILVPPADPARLAPAIVATLADPEAARRRAGHARERFLRRFTVDHVADQMLAFYDRALVGRSARRYRRSRTRPPTPEATSQVPSTRSVAPKRYL